MYPLGGGGGGRLQVFEVPVLEEHLEEWQKFWTQHEDGWKNIP